MRIDCFLPGKSGATAAAADDRIADIRRQGWLFALERAMLAGAARPPREQEQEGPGRKPHADEQPAEASLRAAQQPVRAAGADGLQLSASAWLAAQRGTGGARTAPGFAGAGTASWRMTGAGDAGAGQEIAAPAPAIFRPALAAVAAAGAPLRREAPGAGTEAFHAASAGRYGRRQFHLNVGAEGLLASIRDADLAPAAGYRVATALDRTARQFGVKLAGLTINGKPVFQARSGAPGSISKESAHGN